MILANATENLPQLRDFLFKHLTDSVIPFWLQHAIDEAGGLNTCIRDDGSIVNREKYLWSQWRAVWVFSKLYNQIEKKEEWLRVAENIFQFASRYGWDSDFGGWRLKVAHDGRVLQGCESIYVDAFAMYGLLEFAKASGQEEAVRLARMTAENVLQRLKAPHDQIAHAPYPIPSGARVHGLPMIFSLVFWELGNFCDETRYRDAALEMADDVFRNFYRSDRDLVLERIAADGSEFPPPLGTTVVPGHVIEDMWFQIHIARDAGERSRIEQACRLIKRHIELGWDEVCGGLFLAVDAEGNEDIGWNFPDKKIWWPHTESLYALLLAYEQTSDASFLKWYDRIHKYSFENFSVPEHGEWAQTLDRNGKRSCEVVCLPVKDPFHLPRALIYCIEVLDRILTKNFR